MSLICGAYWRKLEPGRGRKKNSLSALIEIDMLFSLVPQNLGLYFTVNKPLIYWTESNATIIAVCGPRNSIRRLVGCVPLPRLKLLQLFIAAHLDFYVCLFRHKKKKKKKKLLHWFCSIWPLWNFLENPPFSVSFPRPWIPQTLK